MFLVQCKQGNFTLFICFPFSVNAHLLSLLVNLATGGGYGQCESDGYGPMGSGTVVGAANAAGGALDAATLGILGPTNAPPPPPAPTPETTSH
jgi:hypothetical protein